MRVYPICFFVMLAGMVSGQPRPDKINLSIWVREDMFAGLLANDYERLQSGMAKLKTALVQNPNDFAAIVWRGMGELTLAVRAHEIGREHEFSQYYAAAERSFDDAEERGGRYSGVHAVIGAAWGSLGDRLPVSLRADAYEKAYASWRSALTLSEQRFKEKPEHSRGEMLAAMAHAAHKTGRKEEGRRRLEELAAELPGTSFEARAQRWLERPELLDKAHASCQSCHEPGRLKAALEAARLGN